MSRKVMSGVDVLTAARARIAWTFDTFGRIYVSFSGGKDSTVMLHLVMEEAIRRRRRVGVLFVDLEAQYRLTIEHVQACYDLYADHIEPFWCALPLALRNAVSQFQPKWQCWDPDARESWVRQPPSLAITAETHDFPFFRRDMEFEEFVPAFGHWHSRGELTACLVGIRADESLNRFRSIMRDKTRFDGRSWTTWLSRALWNVYPIYDWRTADIWTYHARTGTPYNRIYDRMHQAGLSIDQMRICQPYGDDQRKGLWLYHVIEPDTWPLVVARVHGANFGALYAQESGNILGRIKVEKPDGLTWERYARILLDSLPEKLRDHYEAKIGHFLQWHSYRGYPNGIPDESDPQGEAARKVPSWRRVARTILKNDYWCKGLTFSPHRSESYERYIKIMKRKNLSWRPTAH